MQTATTSGLRSRSLSICASQLTLNEAEQLQQAAATSSQARPLHSPLHCSIVTISIDAEQDSANNSGGRQSRAGGRHERRRALLIRRRASHIRHGAPACYRAPTL